MNSSASNHPNGGSSYPPSQRSSTYVTDSKADLVSMEMSEARVSYPSLPFPFDVKTGPLPQFHFILLAGHDSLSIMKFHFQCSNDKVDKNMSLKITFYSVKMFEF